MVVDATSPANAAEGVALGATISVTFDVEADADAIGQGHFIVTSTASQVVTTGPFFEDVDDDDNDLLTSKSYTGTVNGSIDSDDGITYTFTPSALLSPNTTYTILLGTSIVSRTIEDIVANGGNTSTGTFLTAGPYTDDIPDTFTIEILAGGTLGNATFQYTRTSDGVPSGAIVTDRLVELEEGVYLVFKSGTFVLGDTWTFDTNVGDPLAEIVSFSFTTGDADYEVPSTDTPSFEVNKRLVDGLTRIDGSASDSSDFAMVSTTPEHQQAHVRVGTRTITIVFNKAIDPASLDDAAISVIMENLPFDEEEQMTVPLRVIPTVSGNTLTLTFSG